MADFDELMAKKARGELTDLDIQKELQNYRQALEEEYTAKTEEAPDNTDSHVRDFCRTHVASALAQIVFLMENSDSDTVKMNASKFIVTEAKDESRKDGDPIAEILRGLGVDMEKGVPTS